MPQPALDHRADAYRRRSSLLRLIRPPSPVLHNPAERFLPATNTPRLFIGGAGGVIPPGFLCVDLLLWPGVGVVADAHSLPFRDGTVGAVECDAVLEHVVQPERVVEEFWRVLQPGGYVHVVVPFCHPYHAYPDDYRRWSLEGLRHLMGRFEIVAAGVRTGPTTTMIAYILEYIRVLTPPGLARRASYFIAGWILFPVKYLDYWLLKKPEAHVLANSIFLLARKPI